MHTTPAGRSIVLTATMAHAEPTTSSRGCPEARERSSVRGRDHDGSITSPRGDGNPELGNPRST